MSCCRCPAIESDPEKMSGAWVFTRTRVPISALFGNLEEGATMAEFLDWFEDVEEWQVRAVLEYLIKDLESHLPHVKYANTAS